MPKLVFRPDRVNSEGQSKRFETYERLFAIAWIGVASAPIIVTLSALFLPSQPIISKSLNDSI